MKPEDSPVIAKVVSAVNLRVSRIKNLEEAIFFIARF